MSLRKWVLIRDQGMAAGYYYWEYWSCWEHWGYCTRSYAVRGDERPSLQTRESMSGWKNELKGYVVYVRNQEGYHGENRLEDLHDGRRIG